VLRCVALYYSALQCAAVCCSVLQRVAVRYTVSHCATLSTATLIFLCAAGRGVEGGGGRGVVGCVREMRGVCVCGRGDSHARVHCVGVFVCVCV